jgi:hypothetical protein
MQMVVDVKICSRLVSRMVNIPILGRFHRYVRGIEVTILSNSAVKYKPNTTSLPFKRPLVYVPFEQMGTDRADQYSLRSRWVS